jgi:membrane protein DedA with SNARE-associated domain
MNPSGIEGLAILDWIAPSGGGIGTAASLGIATLVQEDLPTLTAAVLASAGRLSWMTAFLGCALGIWIGDALLYFAARWLGRPLLQVRGFRRLASADAITRSEDWFASRGLWLLASSRFLPGTRLPTYLAAGFLRVPLRQFLGITGAAVAVWTGLLFAAAHLAGPRFQTTLREHPQSLGLVLGGALFLAAGFQFLLRLVARRWVSGGIPTPGQRLTALVDRWRRWEFWPAGVFYIPVVLQYVRLSVRHRSPTLPSCANPGIRAGGLVGESKIETLRQLHATCPEFTAEAWLLEPAPLGERHASLRTLQQRAGIDYPFILKPDLGQRGQGVRLIRSVGDAERCLRETPVPLVVQRYAPGPFEAGVFYYRFPHEERGRLFSITEKVFPHLTGDGRSTIEALIWSDDRARCLASRYLQRLGERRRDVPRAGEAVRLVEAGNHAQGCIFRNGERFHTPELERRFDVISRNLPGFFIGRYDVRFTSEEAFRAGLPGSFTIVELNGAAAEATHIYDAQTSLVEAYRTLFRQWELVFEIGAANRRLGSRPMPLRELLQVWRDASRQFAAYPVAD